MKKIAFFRKKHPRFIYENYSWKILKNDLKISFYFKIEPNIEFHPKITVKNIDKKRVSEIGESILNNLIFNLGLIEIPSYWKATCSPEIIIKAGHLAPEQIKWWKDLIINGMGQYFYENKIDFKKPNFIQINSISSQALLSNGKLGGGRASTKIMRDIQEYNAYNTETWRRTDLRQAAEIELRDRYLVPMGGGRDSIVTLEKLKEKGKDINCFLVNPSIVSKAVLKVAGIKNPVIVERKIDPLLFEMNQQGYLNGHTPFTALLSFLSVFAGVLFDYKNIVFSNEKSSDEGNVRYLGKTINHQWSKSSEFEKRFKDYSKKYLAENINYSSFLRNYTELEISKMFSKYPEYFPVFSSCNAGTKTGKRWCGKCPKCLFVYITLYPFLEEKQLFKIFKKNLYEDKNLLPLLKDLIGKGRAKPFECVGTFKETKHALKLSLKKIKNSGKIPFLLKNIGKSLH